MEAVSASSVAPNCCKLARYSELQVACPDANANLNVIVAMKNILIPQVYWGEPEQAPHKCCVSV